MPKDVVVVVNIDAKPSGTENLDILLLSTEGAKDVAVYRDLDVIKERSPGKRSLLWPRPMFEQGKIHPCRDPYPQGENRLVSLPPPGAVRPKRHPLWWRPWRPCGRPTMIGISC